MLPSPEAGSSCCAEPLDRSGSDLPVRNGAFLMRTDAPRRRSEMPHYGWRCRAQASHQRATKFSVILGPYEGTARIARRTFQQLLDQSPTPERCIEAYHMQRTRFELVVERKLRRRQLTADGNVEITGRDLREKAADLLQPSFLARPATLNHDRTAGLQAAAEPAPIEIERQRFLLSSTAAVCATQTRKTSISTS
jgi:hypothetical protein